MTLNHSLSVNVLDIHIRSEGRSDPNKTPNTCGMASIYVNGVNRSPRKRGHNVVVLDGRTGNICFIEITKAASFAFQLGSTQCFFEKVYMVKAALSLP